MYEATRVAFGGSYANGVQDIDRLSLSLQRTFVFPADAAPTAAFFSVWDQDIGTSDDPLGYAELDLVALLRGSYGPGVFDVVVANQPSLCEMHSSQRHITMMSYTVPGAVLMPCR